MRGQGKLLDFDFYNGKKYHLGDITIEFEDDFDEEEEPAKK